MPPNKMMGVFPPVESNIPSFENKNTNHVLLKFPKQNIFDSSSTEIFINSSQEVDKISQKPEYFEGDAKSFHSGLSDLKVMHHQSTIRGGGESRLFPGR